MLGDDPVKLRLRDALPVMFRAGRQFFGAHEDVTGEQLYAYMTGLAEADGWTFGGTIAGHLVGQFPHEKIAGEDIESYIAPGSDKPPSPIRPIPSGMIADIVASRTPGSVRTRSTSCCANAGPVVSV